MNPLTRELIDLDRRHLWHPFTPHHIWNDPQFEPLIISSGKGSELFDSEGRSYLDGNSSIWTNLHGHCRQEITHAIKQQLDRIAHSSFLGLGNEPAPRLGARLARLAGPPIQRSFFSDDGSTAIEAALKIIHQFNHQNGLSNRKTYVSLGGAYHGDTVGAMSLSHSPQFHAPYNKLLFPGRTVPAPACYRCPHNLARPEKFYDARLTRKCSWQCLDTLDQALQPDDTAALILEPRVQGAAGVLMQPEGYVAKAIDIATANNTRVIADEVMTGCGRTGPFFAYQRNNPQRPPDAIALAKGLTGGTLPFAATLLAEDLYQGFGGGLERTLFHGHSYCGNQLGCAAALASLELLDTVHNQQHRETLGEKLGVLAQVFWRHPNVGDVRREGTILAIELVSDFATRQPFDPALRLGAAVCEAARQHGLLTRPVGNVLLLMPPYCSSDDQLERMVHALFQSLNEILPAPLNP